MKRKNALCLFMIAAGACAPAWSQDYLGDSRANPYGSSSANAFGANDPYGLNSLTNPYGRYGEPHSDESAANPYALDSPKSYGQYGDYGGAGNANPYDLYSASKPYGGYGDAYSPPFAADHSALDLSKSSDSLGRRYDYPCAVANPYDRDGPCEVHGPPNPSTGYGDPYADPSSADPYAADAQRTYDRYGYDRRMTSNPYDPYSVSNPYNSYLAPNPYAGYDNLYGSPPDAHARVRAAPPKPDDHYRDGDAGLTANPMDSSSASRLDGDSDNLSGRQPVRDPFAGDRLKLPDQGGALDRGSAAKAQKRRAAPSPYGGGNLSGSRPAASQNAEGLDAQGGGYGGGLSSNPANGQAASDPVRRGIHPSLPGSPAYPSGSTNP